MLFLFKFIIWAHILLSNTLFSWSLHYIIMYIYIFVSIGKSYKNFHFSFSFFERKKIDLKFFWVIQMNLFKAPSFCWLVSLKIWLLFQYERLQIKHVGLTMLLVLVFVTFLEFSHFTVPFEKWSPSKDGNEVGREQMLLNTLSLHCWHILLHNPPFPRYGCIILKITTTFKDVRCIHLASPHSISITFLLFMFNIFNLFRVK